MSPTGGHFSVLVDDGGSQVWEVGWGGGESSCGRAQAFTAGTPVVRFKQADHAQG